MSETPKPTPKDEVARITAEQNAKDLGEKGVPSELAQVIPGASWLIEHGGHITGHIEEDTGDIVIDTHE